MESIHLYPHDFHHFNLTRFDTGGSTTLRSGDWICLNCNNFNYSFRNICNRCKQQSKSQNMELQNIIKSIEANVCAYQIPLQNNQTGKDSSASNHKIWFSEMPQTGSFSSVVFLFVSDSTVEKQFESSSLNPKLSICSARTAGSSSDQFIFKSESKENSMEWEQETLESEDGDYIDAYLLNILND